MKNPNAQQYEESIGYLYDVTEYDWFSLDTVRTSLYRVGLPVKTPRDLIEAVDWLVPGLAERSIYPGDLAKEGFVPWNLSSAEATERIIREIEQLGRIPKVTEICWFFRVDPENRPPVSKS